MLHGKCFFQSPLNAHLLPTLINVETTAQQQIHCPTTVAAFTAPDNVSELFTLAGLEADFQKTANRALPGSTRS